MDTMKDTKMQPATDAVIDTLRKMQPTAWVYEDMLGRKCVGFERPLHRRNTHEPLFSAATHAVVMGLVNRLEAAEKERDALRTALEKIADWDSAWGPYPETNEAWRAMVIVTAREAVPRRGEKK